MNRLPETASVIFSVPEETTFSAVHPGDFGRETCTHTVRTLDGYRSQLRPS
ncbi:MULTISPECIES: hypothetical protein [unclassified Mycolicibacterium]|uniref:hypothetical protein n=1 Tax=unclassified Mycolicibacterium TaxID=2636767 RepID=UPI0012DEBF1B|nr:MULTISPECIES: hypothetical protein [unclassified Mycolicibacterium]